MISKTWGQLDKHVMSQMHPIQPRSAAAPGDSERHPSPAAHKEALVVKRSTPHPNITPSPSTWAQNHEFSKSLETTQTGSQGARGFQRRGAAFPFMSTSCPTAHQPPPAFPSVCPTIIYTNTCRVRTALCRSLFSPFSLPS